MATIKVKEGIEIYPEGLYHLKVSNIIVREAKYGDNAGNSFLSWEDEILDSQDESYIGETYKHTTPLTISPRSKYFPLLEVLGVVIPEDVKELEYDTDDFIGQEFIASVKISKVTQGRNAGGEKNEFAQLWTPTAFAEQQEKSKRMANKFSKKESETKSVQSTLSQKVSEPKSESEQAPTETVKPVQPARKSNIFQGANLSDFPE